MKFNIFDVFNDIKILKDREKVAKEKFPNSPFGDLLILKDSKGNPIHTTSEMRKIQEQEQEKK